MYGLLDISTSGMVAQRARHTAAMANIANKDSILDEQGLVNPYRERRVILAPGDPFATTLEGQASGVHVREIEVSDAPPRMQYDPGHPLAYKSGAHAGYVPVPDIDPIKQSVNAMEASRAYEANVVAAESAKQMMLTALRLLA